MLLCKMFSGPYTKLVSVVLLAAIAINATSNDTAYTMRSSQYRISQEHIQDIRNILDSGLEVIEGVLDKLNEDFEDRENQHFSHILVRCIAIMSLQKTVDQYLLLFPGMSPMVQQSLSLLYPEYTPPNNITIQAGDYIEPSQSSRAHPDTKQRGSCISNTKQRGSCISNSDVDSYQNLDDEECVDNPKPTDNTEPIDSTELVYDPNLDRE